jgi:hypothetical protein
MGSATEIFGGTDAGELAVPALPVLTLAKKRDIAFNLVQDKTARCKLLCGCVNARPDPNCDIWFGSRHDARMIKLFLQLR